MSKKTTAVIKARRKVMPTASAPALAPALPVDADEAATKAAKLTNPHATGADRTAVLRARVAAAHQRHMHKAATGKALPTPTKPTAKPTAKRKKKAAVKPAVPPLTSY